MSDAAGERGIGAVFDLDNTLLPGISAERLFVQFLIAKRLLGARAMAATFLIVLRHIRYGPARALRTHRPYLRGGEVARLRQLGEEAVATVVTPRLSPYGVGRMAEHARAGHRTAIVSGSLPFLLGPLGRRLGAQVVIGTPLASEGAYYTGNLAGEHMYGLEKAVVTRRFARDERLDLTRSYGYADHHSDVFFLELFGRPTCVNPTARLKQVARARGWPTDVWSAPAPH